MATTDTDRERAEEAGPKQASTLAEQRRGLPDQPGVYLFRDGSGRVIYVGKAKSVRKRVASHFSKAQVPSSPGHAEMVATVEQVECVVVASEAEALLAEQSFIKQYRPRFNIRLRDDKSYPFIAISLDEAYPRVYFTRERHRGNRAYFGPYSNAKRVRSTLEVLAKVFMFRSCTGTEPGRRSGSPCLDYYIKRCGAPCVGYVSREEYRAAIDGVIDFLSGRFSAIERDLENRMREAAASEEFEQATLERNRLQAVRSLLERRRVTGDSMGTFDAVAVALDGREANAQVFQVRDGVLSDRQSFYLSNETEREPGEVAEEFMLQYYGGQISIPALLVAQREAVAREALAEALASRRGGPLELRAAERGEKRRILELAERNARLALDQDKLRSERRRQGRVEALEGLQTALGLDAPPVRIECFDISNLGGTHTVASMVVFEGGAAKKSDYRRFKIRSTEGAPDDLRLDGGGARTPLRAVGAPDGHLSARPRARPELRLAAEPRRDRRRQGAARGRPRPAAGLPRARGGGRSPWPSGSRRSSSRVAAAPLVLDHSTPELQLLQRVARRGPPLRDHPPPHPPRPRDDELACSTNCPVWARPASAPCWPTSARPDAVAGRLPRGAAGGPGAAREGRPRPARLPAPRGLSRPRSRGDRPPHGRAA